MNKLKAYKYEVLLSLINFVITAFCILYKEIYIQHIALLIMTFMSFLLYSHQQISLKIYVLLTLCIFVIFTLILYLLANAMYMDIINAYGMHLLLLISSAYIRKKLSN